MDIQHEVGTADGFLSPHGESRPIHRGLVFAIVALVLLMMSINSTIVATALHALRMGLQTSIDWAGWTITAYSLGFVVMLPISGKLSEQYGCRKVFICSVAAFTLASLFCGLADNIYVLVALRALQAVGGAGFTPSATEIIVNYFGDTRDRAVSMFGSIFAIGTMIGPIFGGLFVSYWSWRGIFLVNVPIGVAVIVLALRYVPRDPSRAGAKRSSMDVTGMALLGGGLLSGMLAASYLAERNAEAWSPAFMILTATAIVVLWLFFRHINRSAHPFIAPRLISGAGFGIINLVNGVYGGVTSGVIALVPLYAWNRYGINELHSGTLLIGQGAATILLSIGCCIRLAANRLPAAAVCRGRCYCSRDAAAGADPGRGYLAVCVACRCHFTYRNRPWGEQPRGPQRRTATGAGKFLDPCCITNHVSANRHNLHDLHIHCTSRQLR